MWQTSIGRCHRSGLFQTNQLPFYSCDGREKLQPPSTSDFSDFLAPRGKSNTWNDSAYQVVAHIYPHLTRFCCFFATFIFGKRECLDSLTPQASGLKTAHLKFAPTSVENVAERESVCCKSNSLRTNPFSLSNWLFLGQGSTMCCSFTVVHVTTKAGPKPRADPDWSFSGMSSDYWLIVLTMSPFALNI